LTSTTAPLHSTPTMAIKRERVIVTIYTCERCEHRWTPRKPLETIDPDPPKVCASCRSKYWNTPRGLIKPGPKPAK
jgi:DNA-directed RNA polymerase subunit RPC12/RpoP